MPENDPTLAPALSVELVDLAGTPDPAVWRTTWRLANQAAGPLEVLECWFPHDQFHRSREAYEPVRSLAPGQSLRLAADLTCRAAPREVVENAFLILRTRYGGRGWRVFTRLRIDCDEAGRPQPVVEAVSVQAVGVSGT